MMNTVFPRMQEVGMSNFKTFSKNEPGRREKIHRKPRSTHSRDSGQGYLSMKTITPPTLSVKNKLSFTLFSDAA
jgi:hypothetical protein